MSPSPSTPPINSESKKRSAKAAFFRAFFGAVVINFIGLGLIAFLNQESTADTKKTDTVSASKPVEFEKSEETFSAEPSIATPLDQAAQTDENNLDQLSDQLEQSADSNLSESSEGLLPDLHLSQINQGVSIAAAKSGGNGSGNSVLTLKEDQVDVRPHLSNRVPPIYPKDARREEIEGYVILEVLVSAEGRVLDAKILSEEPANVFSNAALTAIRKSSYTPARFQNRPVQVRVKQRVTFSLK